MENSLNVLLENAVLHIVEFNIHSRREMKTFRRVLPHYVMSYHKKGFATLRVNETVVPIEPGTVVLIPPYVEHDHFKENDDESVFLWWHFTFSIGNVIDVFKLFDLPYMFKLVNSEAFEQIFIQYMESTATDSFLPTKILEKAKALELLYHLLVGAMNERRTEIEDHQMQSFLEITAQFVCYPERNTSLEMLSKKLNMHPTYVSNRFKEIFGKSPIRVQREMKIHKAKTLLKTSELTINEISEAVGFSGIPSFSRLFKAYVGISPSNYRELHKQKI